MDDSTTSYFDASHVFCSTDSIDILMAASNMADSVIPLSSSSPVSCSAEAVQDGLEVLAELFVLLSTLSLAVESSLFSSSFDVEGTSEDVDWLLAADDCVGPGFCL